MGGENTKFQPKKRDDLHSVIRYYYLIQNQQIQEKLYDLDYSKFESIKKFWNTELITPYWIKCNNAAESEDYKKLKTQFEYM